VKCLSLSTEESVYRELQQQIDKMPVGMPASESGADLRILKHLFTPEEAKIALHLNIVPEPLERIYKRAKRADNSITLEKLEDTLDHLAKKGRILGSDDNGLKKYSYALLVIGMYEFQVDRLTRAFYEDCEEYLLADFAKEYARAGIPQLRTVPVNAAMPHELHVATYDDIREIIRNAEGEFGVRNCICKQGKDLIDENCKLVDFRDHCISLPGLSLPGSSGKSLLERPESFRPISKEETLELLQRAEDAGLVIQPANTQDPGFICCCCGDCCGVLTVAKAFPKPAEVFATNYYAEVDPELCKGCKKCAKRCQMEAITIVEKQSIVDLDRCIGCGLCISTCSNEAMKLKRKEKETVPPQTSKKLYNQIMMKKYGKVGLAKVGAKIALRKKI
jgi:ferredoxin